MPSLLHASLDRGPLFFRRHNEPAGPMRLLSAIAFLTSFAVAAAARAAPLPLPRQVDIPSGSAVLHAQLYRPDGNGPFPVVIALPGWGGRPGDLSSFYLVTAVESGWRYLE